MGPHLTLGETITGRYRILKLLGVGGMGAVYQAWDDRLGVAVALKVIKPDEAGDDPQTLQTLERRFKRELLLARQVTHKNVVRIHDLGEVDGTSYITMPYIDGANLSTILSTEGRLPVDRAIGIARQVASGLLAAHEAGVIHRDLKPANIMVTAEDGRALIMDFGIARPMSGSAFATHTHTGVIVGTLDYMAPEQAEGKPVDQRCDIYAFGLILYDMLTGGRRSNVSAVADLMQRLQKPLPALATVNPTVPDALAQVVQRCIERDADARYQTTAELVAALDALDDHGFRRTSVRQRVSGRDLLVAAVLVVTVLGGVWAWRSRPVPAPAAALHEPVSVLIADFENRANDPVFDGSIEQALTIGVEGASFITTYPRDAARRLATQLAAGKVDEATARLISVRDGVKFILAGAIEPSRGGYTISTRLIDPGVEKVVATQSKTAKTKSDVLQAVGAIAASVRRDLGDNKPESARLAASETFTTSSLEAVREYTLAQDLANNSRFEDAITHYKRAVDADAQFGRAYSGWALSSFDLGRQEEAAELWKRALALMDRMTDRERFRTMGSYNLAIAHNYQQAVENYSQLVASYPSDRAGHNNLAIAYFNLLDIRRARDEQRKAVEIYKGSFKFRNNLVLYAMYDGDFTAAIDGARELIKEDPKFADAYVPLAISLSARGDRTAARTAYEAMAGLGQAAASTAAMGLADLDFAEGKLDAAEARLTRAAADDEAARNTLGQASKYAALAAVYQALDRPARALEFARKALGVARPDSIALPAARIFSSAGQVPAATALSRELDQNLQTQTRVYARIIDGEVALAQGRLTDAVEYFRAASRMFDLWVAHFDLGIAYVRAGHFAEALAEFDACVKRQGEATAMFLDDVPTFRYLAPLAYWRGRAQEGLGMKGAAAESLKAYSAIRPTGLP